MGQVTVVAPDREQSGTSHSLTMHRPLRPARRPDGAWQVDGTPTDCVLLALGALMPERPDFVFSGVNHGPNMGEDVLYSGTVAVAMEAVTLGVPGIGISFAGNAADLETMSSYARAAGRHWSGGSPRSASFPRRPCSTSIFPPCRRPR